MKVVLMQDVAKIGRKHAVVEVPAGYAQNQLIPKGQAKPATPENLKAVERLNSNAAAAAEASISKFIEAKRELQEKPLLIRGQKSDHGHLFAALKPVQIVAAAAEAGIELDPTWIKLETPIKTTGEHAVDLSHQDKAARITINVE